MKNILEQLYDGEIFPAEQYFPKEKEYRKKYQEHYNHYEDFIEILSKLEPPLDKRFIRLNLLRHTYPVRVFDTCKFKNLLQTA